MPTETTEVKDLKLLVERGDLESMKAYILDVFETRDDVDPAYTFQKVYLHACLKKKGLIAEWLQSECFQHLDSIQQIAIRQVFSYGKYLLKK